MSRSRYLIFAILLTSITANSQVLNQDAAGKSSILVQGSSINLDITDAAAQISHNGSFDIPKWDLTKGVWGFDLKAKNSSGLANLFSSEKFTPEGTLSGLFGIRTTKFQYPDNSFQDKADLMSQQADLITKVSNLYQRQVALHVAASTLGSTEQATVKSELLALTKKGLVKLPMSLSSFKSSVTTVADVAKIDAVTGLLVSDMTKAANELNNIAAAIDETHVPTMIPNTTTYHYLRSGVSATEFTYDKANNANTYDARFMDTISTSFYIEYGLTRQWKKNFFGVNFGYSRLSNSADLTSADYTYDTQDTSLHSGKLSKKQSFKGYSGKYGFYKKFYLNLDYQHLFLIDQSKYLALGPYLRYNNVYQAEDLAKNTTVLGISANYLDGKAGKFLGGIYFQSDDISGSNEKDFKKTLKFGLVAKFTLSSIFLFK